MKYETWRRIKRKVGKARKVRVVFDADSLSASNFVFVNISGDTCPFDKSPCMYVSCCDAVLGLENGCPRAVGHKRSS